MRDLQSFFPCLNTYCRTVLVWAEASISAFTVIFAAVEIPLEQSVWICVGANCGVNVNRDYLLRVRDLVSLFSLVSTHTGRLVGLVVQASASRAEDPGSNPACAGIFPGSSHTSDLENDTVAWRYRVSTGTGRAGVSIL